MEKLNLREYLKNNPLLKEVVISKYIETVEEDGDVYEDFKIDVVRDYIVNKYDDEIADAFMDSKEWEDARYSFFDVGEESTDSDVEEFLDNEMDFYFGGQIDDSGNGENVDFKIEYEDVNGDIQVVTINAPSDEEAVRKASEIEGFVIAKSLESI